FCLGCPYGGPDGGICWEGHVPGKDFRTVLFVEHPDAGDWADRLWDERARARDATKAAKEAAAALSAVVHAGGIPSPGEGRWARAEPRGRAGTNGRATIHECVNCPHLATRHRLAPDAPSIEGPYVCLECGCAMMRSDETRRITWAQALRLHGQEIDANAQEMA